MTFVHFISNSTRYCLRPGRVLYFNSILGFVEWPLLILEVTLLGITYRLGRVLYFVSVSGLEE